MIATKGMIDMGGSATFPTNGNNNSSPMDGNGEGRDKCPKKLKAVVTGPALGIATGARLEVTLDSTSSPPRVVLVDPTSNSIVGSLAGIPNLDVLLGCLENGVGYRAFVDSVDGGRVDVTVTQQ